MRCGSLNTFSDPLASRKKTTSFEGANRKKRFFIEREKAAVSFFPAIQSAVFHPIAELARPISPPGRRPLGRSSLWLGLQEALGPDSGSPPTVGRTLGVGFRLGRTGIRYLKASISWTTTYDGSWKVYVSLAYDSPCPLWSSFRSWLFPSLFEQIQSQLPSQSRRGCHRHPPSQRRSRSERGKVAVMSLGAADERRATDGATGARYQRDAESLVFWDRGPVTVSRKTHQQH